MPFTLFHHGKVVSDIFKVIIKMKNIFISQICSFYVHRLNSRHMIMIHNKVYMYVYKIMLYASSNFLQLDLFLETFSYSF